VVAEMSVGVDAQLFMLESVARFHSAGDSGRSLKSGSSASSSVGDDSASISSLRLHRFKRRIGSLPVMIDSVCCWIDFSSLSMLVPSAGVSSSRSVDSSSVRSPLIILLPCVEGRIVSSLRLEDYLRLCWFFFSDSRRDEQERGITVKSSGISLGPGVGSVSSLVIDGRCSGYLSASRIHLVSACLSVLKSGSWSGYSSVYSAFLSLGVHWEVESALELKAALVPRFFLLSDLSAMLSSLMIVPQYCREFLGTLSMLDFSGISSALGLVKVFPLSISSVLIPFSSFNQSPRNIYQSSMAKQSISLHVLFLCLVLF